jgi:hypothetical protein
VRNDPGIKQVGDVIYTPYTDDDEVKSLLKPEEVVALIANSRKDRKCVVHLNQDENGVTVVIYVADYGQHEDPSECGWCGATVRADVKKMIRNPDSDESIFYRERLKFLNELVNSALGKKEVIFCEIMQR